MILVGKGMLCGALAYDDQDDFKRNGLSTTVSTNGPQFTRMTTALLPRIRLGPTMVGSFLSSFLQSCCGNKYSLNQEGTMTGTNATPKPPSTASALTQTSMVAAIVKLSA
jgi:hypothetical protein